MIILFTGLPGAGKTLHAIKHVLETEELKNRTVYYFNITDCSVEGWQEIDEEGAVNWFDLPKGSVVLIDEVQRLFRQRGAKQAVPHSVEMMETHRHLGIDLILTCQASMQLDIAVRRLVGKQYHLERSFSMNSFRMVQFEKCVNDPSDYHARKEAQITRGKLDKKIFSLYKSAEIHTHKRTLPKKAYMFAGLTAMIVVFIGYTATRIYDRFDSSPLVKQEQQSDAPILAANMFNPIQFQTQSYLNRFKTRISAIPMSAPLYDTIVEPVTYPRVTGCMHIEIGKAFSCQCNTQQGTVIDMPYDLCMAYFRYGNFDFSKEDEEHNQYLPSGNPPGERQSEEIV